MASFSSLIARVGDPSAPLVLPPVGAMGDQALLDAQRAVAEVQRRLSAISAAVAGEIAHRSRRELGHSGLAQSRGQRTAEGLISQLSGTSARDARLLVKAGELVPVEASRPDTAPVAAWLAVIGAAVGDARISVEAASVIRSRLAAALRRDAPDASPEALEGAARRLVAEAPGLTIERLAIRAGQVRDELDAAGVADREEAQRDKRFLRLTPANDGMVRVHGLLDRESAAIVVPVLDALTSPRRSGPRFVEPDATAPAADIVRDERTADQLVLDTFVELIRVGARVDDGRLLGQQKPAVRILVTARDLHEPRDSDGHRPGAAYFDGQSESVSVATAERLICSTGAIPLLFDDDGQALDLGRSQRLFSDKQRIALAARDGGCLMCDRPPLWCEAHHIDHWDEHRGRTDIADGVLLCRFCHLLVHNRGWRITRTAADYFVERPEGDGVVRCTPLPSRSPALARLLATA